MRAEEFAALITAIVRRGGRPYLVGGVVRDVLLGHALIDRDLDLVMEGDAAAFARALARELGGEARVFPKFLTAKVLLPAGVEIDIATARTETYSAPGALPTVAAARLEEDFARRDFTINAMAVPLERIADLLRRPECMVEGVRGAVIDRHGGLADLQARIVRILHPQSFRDDPTRAFRACRYAARIGGALEAATGQALQAMLAAGGFEHLSWYRKLQELRHFFEEQHPAQGWEMAVRHGVVAALKVLDGRTAAQFGAQLAALEALAVRDAPRGGADLAQRVGVSLLYRVDGARHGLWNAVQLTRAERHLFETVRALDLSKEWDRACEDLVLVAVLVLAHASGDRPPWLSAAHGEARHRGLIGGGEVV